jgi:uncharacterized protein (DUF1778 family)
MNWGQFMPRVNKKNQRHAGESERIELRLRPDQRRRIERAAALEGKSISDFIVSSAYAAAMRTIESSGCWVLSGRDSEIFVNALLNPPEPNSHLKAAVRRDLSRCSST